MPYVCISSAYLVAKGRSFLNYAVLLSTAGRHLEAVEQIERALAALHEQAREAEEPRNRSKKTL